MRGEFERAHAAVQELEALNAGSTRANQLAGVEVTIATLALLEGRFDEAWQRASAAALVAPEIVMGWLVAAMAAYRLRDGERLGRAVAATESEVTDDFRMAVRETIAGYAALHVGRSADATARLRAAQELWRRLRDVTGEPFAAAGLVAALGPDTSEGRAVADELRATLQGLRASALLGWLDDVLRQASEIRAAGTSTSVASDVRVRSGGG
jgi:hypothetical protein